MVTWFCLQVLPFFFLTNFSLLYRFASFIEGSPHLLDSEIIEYETSGINNSDISDDSDDDDDNDNVDNRNNQSVPAPINKSTQKRQLPAVGSSNNRSLGFKTNNNPRYRGRNLTKSMQTSTPIENGRHKNGNLANGQRYDSQLELSEEDD